MLRPWDQGGRAVGVRAAVRSLASEITLIKSMRTARALSPVGQSSTSRAENNTLLFTDLSLSTFVFHFVQNEVNNGRDTCSSAASLPVGWLHQVEPYSSESCLLSTYRGKRWTPPPLHLRKKGISSCCCCFSTLLVKMSKTLSFISFPFLEK